MFYLSKELSRTDVMNMAKNCTRKTEKSSFKGEMEYSVILESEVTAALKTFKRTKAVSPAKVAIETRGSLEEVGIVLARTMYKRTYIR